MITRPCVECGDPVTVRAERRHAPVECSRCESSGVRALICGAVLVLVVVFVFVLAVTP